MARDLFFIDIKVKPYVKQYLINEFGNRVYFDSEAKYYSTFLSLLSKGCKSLNNQEVDEKCIVRFHYSEDVFYRHGFSMSKSNMRMLNNAIEQDIKFIMRTHIGCMAVLGYSIAESIRHFQTKFNFGEDVWPFESIKKDIDRNTDTKKENFVDDFLKQYSLTLGNDIAQLYNEKDNE